MKCNDCYFIMLSTLSIEKEHGRVPIFLELMCYYFIMLQAHEGIIGNIKTKQRMLECLLTMQEIHGFFGIILWKVIIPYHGKFFLSDC